MAGPTATTSKEQRTEAPARSVRQVEHAFDGVADRVGRLVERAVARTREEAEDLWAEAQAVRHGDLGAPARHGSER
jgi:hypothetical protein